jgi:hypothetical protein
MSGKGLANWIGKQFCGGLLNLSKSMVDQFGNDLVRRQEVRETAIRTSAVSIVQIPRDHGGIPERPVVLPDVRVASLLQDRGAASVVTAMANVGVIGEDGFDDM